MPVSLPVVLCLIDNTGPGGYEIQRLVAPQVLAMRRGLCLPWGDGTTLKRSMGVLATRPHHHLGVTELERLGHGMGVAGKPPAEGTTLSALLETALEENGHRRLYDFQHILVFTGNPDLDRQPPVDLPDDCTLTWVYRSFGHAAKPASRPDQGEVMDWDVWQAVLVSSLEKGQFDTLPAAASPAPRKKTL
jgi:hypothetical protein